MIAIRSVKLNGDWKLYFFPQNQYDVQKPGDLQKEGLKPIKATVPGNVELDLAAAGLLPEDLFLGNNIHKVKDYELHEWWYQLNFDAPNIGSKEKYELCFRGVDCIAEYWLNGDCIGNSSNMLVEHSFDVTDKLNQNAPNELTIRIKSPIIEAMNKDYSPYMLRSWGATNYESLWIRKAPHGYGWDIMPRVVSAGLWRDVELIIRDSSEISDLFFFTGSAGVNRARLGINYNVKIDPSLLKNLSISFSGNCGESAFSSTQKIYFTAGTLWIDIENPKLWWPAGYGDSNLYSIKTELMNDGRVIAARTDKIGLRTVELVRTQLTSSERTGEFLFKVNGVPIMAKGSNWVPADAFHSRDKERYGAMLQLFKDSGCNIIRCWGGNVYEDHEFFDICDENGFMVWQDLAMACALYPQEDEFFGIIHDEAEFIVKKLRNHPSIILWSGDNEVDACAFSNGLKPSYNRITREVLPQVLHQFDPYRPYLESSPYISPEVEASGNLSLMPEDHLWGPRDYFKSRFYTESKAHFVSETGYHGCPGISSVKKFIEEDKLWPWNNNEQWITHCTEAIGPEGPYSYRIKLMADQIKELFGYYPDNLEEFALASQISQAEAKKFFIERIRLKKWRTTGIIWWNMIDGWPQFSDAVVDYYFNKKLAYYYIKRVQQPVCLMVDEPENWNVRVVVGNDSLENVKGQFRIWDADSDETLLSGSFSSHANANSEIGRIRVSRGDQRLFLIEWTVEGKKYYNHYLLGQPSFSFSQYSGWLKKIAELDNSFIPSEIGK